jgi:hypothetical protein
MADYLCWDEYRDRDDGIIIEDAESPEDAAFQYVEKIGGREGLSEVDKRLVSVVGPEHKTHVFQIDIHLEPVVYLIPKVDQLKESS